MIHTVSVAFLNLSYATIGGVLITPTRTAAELPRLARYGLAYLLGSIVCGATAFALAIAGLGLPWYAVVAAAAPLGMAAWRVNIREPAGPMPTPSNQAEKALLAALALASCILVLATAVQPPTDTDGWAIWGAKAHALFLQGSVDTTLFTGRAYARTHPDYPLLLPSLEALELRALTRFSPSALDVQLALIVAAFGFALWGVLRLTIPGWVAAIAALVIIGNPDVVQNVTWNYADAPLALFVTLSLVFLERWIRLGERGDLMVAALLLVGASLTKNEGLLFVVAALVAGAAAGRRDRGRLRALLAVACVVVIADLPWRIWLAYHRIGNSDLRVASVVDPVVLIDRGDRVVVSAARLAQEMLGSSWGLLWWPALGALVATLAMRQRHAPTMFAVFAAVSFAGLVASYWISLLPIQWHLDHSAHRIVSTVVVAGLPLGLLALSTAWLPSARDSHRVAMSAGQQRR